MSMPSQSPGVSCFGLTGPCDRPHSKLYPLMQLAIDKTLSQMDDLGSWVGRRPVISGVLATAIVTWLSAGYLLSGSHVAAAEIDAVGVPAVDDR
jgi:hypothetical protein